MTERIADIDRARAAVDESSWSEAYDLFRALEPLDDPHDRERFADAAWWTGRIEESIAARQKAYTGYAEEGDDRRAGWMSARLCMEYFLRDEPAVGAGWFACLWVRANHPAPTAGSSRRKCSMHSRADIHPARRSSPASA